MFEIYTKGFIKGCAGQLPKSEIMLLPEGAKMMTIECGMRFLTDYLNGDKYFKIHYPDQNLARARCHLALSQDIVKKLDTMQAIVEKYGN